MPSLSEIRTALTTTVTSAIDPLHGYATIPEVINLPAVVAVPRETDFQGAMGRGLDIHEIDLIVLVSRRDDMLAQTDLDDFVNGFGDLSIRQAIWQTSALGLDNCSASVRRMRSYGATFDIGDLPHVGAILEVAVATTGTS